MKTQNKSAAKKAESKKNKGKKVGITPVAPAKKNDGKDQPAEDSKKAGAGKKDKQPRQGEFKGVTPDPTNHQRLFQTVLDAKDTKDVASNRVKKLEEELRISMRRDKINLVKCLDTAGIKRCVELHGKDVLKYTSK